MPAFWLKRAVYPVGIDEATSCIENPDMPDITSLVVFGIQFDRLERMNRTHIVEQEQPDPRGMATE
jgi:hypothetical protein